jgi:hypothetical protein
MATDGEDGGVIGGLDGEGHLRSQVRPARSARKLRISRALELLMFWVGCRSGRLAC